MNEPGLAQTGEHMLYIIAVDEEVEIEKRAQRRIAIGALSEERPLERHGWKSARGKQPQDLRELLAGSLSVEP